jgi:signal recognition particle receptor subunit beta
MVVLNYTGGEINAKIVYYGPGLSGKTTNLEFIHEKTPVGARGKMVSMKTQTDRTLFFDFLPLELGEIGGFRTRFLLYTVPGQVYYNATRKLVLKGVDAVVFVADSSRAKLEENLESLRNLEQNLNEHGLTLDELPWVIQYNKRDAADALPVNDLNARINPLRVQTYEAVATHGDGVYETFHGIATLMYRVLKDRLERGELEADAGGRSPAMAEVTPSSATRPPRSPVAPPPPPSADEDPGVEVELDSAIDTMLREVDAPAGRRAPGSAPRSEPSPAPPARATAPAAPRPAPAPRASAPAAVPPAREPRPAAPAPAREVRPAAPPRSATAPGHDVSQFVNSNRSPAAAPPREESSSADDGLFEAVPEGTFDLELGRLPALDEAVFASDHARDQGPDEFVTDPMRRTPRAPRKQEAPRMAPAVAERSLADTSITERSVVEAGVAEPAAAEPRVVEPGPVTIPVVLKRSQFSGGVVRILLSVRLLDD